MTQTTFGKLLKGLYSLAVAVLGALGASLSGQATFTSVSDSQWVWIALAGLVAFGGTFGLAGWSGPSVGNGSTKGSSGGS
jgi:hypothetical protein